MSDQDHVPHSVDLHVGARLRVRRKFLGLSQTDLANHIGKTFQQLQKYERGANRISCSVLFELAHALKCPISYFFDGLDQVAGASFPSEASAQGFLATSEGIAIAQSFPKMRPKLRRRILSLVETLAEGDDEELAAAE